MFTRGQVGLGSEVDHVSRDKSQRAELLGSSKGRLPERKIQGLRSPHPTYSQHLQACGEDSRSEQGVGCASIMAGSVKKERVKTMKWVQ